MGQAASCCCVSSRLTHAEDVMEESTMANKTLVLWVALLILPLLVRTTAFANARYELHAAGKDDGHHHGGRDDHHGKSTQPKTQEHEDKAHHSEGEQSGTHAHPWWETPPPEYASKRSTRWTDTAAIARGKQLFQINCMVCHGTDGRGTGPAAKGLPHPPADLTNHFHNKPGDGDAYLFWRVSEGGMVEPFKSMQSTMPPFKTALSADQRWDVLAYVHRQFHRGFKSESMAMSTQAMAASVTGEGNVIAVTLSNNQLVVDHDAIKGFMDAMIMGYKVNPPSLLDGLNAGDRVRFTVDTQQKAIVGIEKLNK
jgi:mono/diheme cytochrome c family protein